MQRHPHLRAAERLPSGQPAEARRPISSGRMALPIDVALLRMQLECGQPQGRPRGAPLCTPAGRQWSPITGTFESRSTNPLALVGLF